MPTRSSLDGWQQTPRKASLQLEVHVGSACPVVWRWAWYCVFHHLLLHELRLPAVLVPIVRPLLRPGIGVLRLVVVHWLGRACSRLSPHGLLVLLADFVICTLCRAIQPHLEVLAVTGCVVLSIAKSLIWVEVQLLGRGRSLHLK